MIEAFVGAALVAVPTAIVYLVRTLARVEPRPVKEPRCTGYVLVHGAGMVFTDCRALRDPCCGDGRCGYHCGRMCKCSASNEPERIGRARR